MYVTVMQCDVCHKLTPDESKCTVEGDKSFCESCVNATKATVGKIKDLRALHILVDVCAKLLDEAEKEKEAKKDAGISPTSTPATTTTPAGNSGSAGFSPPGAAH